MQHHRHPLPGSAAAGPCPVRGVTGGRQQLSWWWLCSPSADGPFITPPFCTLSAGFEDTMVGAMDPLGGLLFALTLKLCAAQHL